MLMEEERDGVPVQRAEVPRRQGWRMAAVKLPLDGYQLGTQVMLTHQPSSVPAST